MVEGKVMGMPPHAPFLFQPPPKLIEAREIARSFVQQYYAVLHERPDQLHRFYGPKAILTDNATSNAIVLGQQHIQQRVMAIGFAASKAILSHVDSQPGLGGSVIVVVDGMLYSATHPLRHFHQSFVLACTDNMFFIQNDVLHFSHPHDNFVPDLGLQAAACASAACWPMDIPTTPASMPYLSATDQTTAEAMATPMEPVPVPTSVAMLPPATVSVPMAIPMGRPMGMPVPLPVPIPPVPMHAPVAHSAIPEEPMAVVAAVVEPPLVEDMVVMAPTLVEDAAPAVLDAQQPVVEVEGEAVVVVEEGLVIIKQSKEVAVTPPLTETAPKSWASVVGLLDDQEAPSRPKEDAPSTLSVETKENVAAEAKTEAAFTNDNNSNSVVYVSNIPYDAALEVLKEKFTRYGEIKTINFKSDKGYAFIEYSCVANAQQAIDIVAATGLEVGGRQLVVEHRKSTLGLNKHNHQGGKGKFNKHNRHADRDRNTKKRGGTQNDF